MIKNILCAIDGSDHSEKAAAFASDLALRYDARLHFLHVFMRGMSVNDLQQFADHAHLRDLIDNETDEFHKSISTAIGPYATPYVPAPSASIITKIGEVVLTDVKFDAEKLGVKDVTTQMLDGDAANVILTQAKELEADLIVMGNRGLGAVSGLLFGSVSNKVSHLCECTCISVK